MNSKEEALQNAIHLLSLSNANLQLSTNSVRPEIPIATAQACAQMAQVYIMLHDRLPEPSLGDVRGLCGARALGGPCVLVRGHNIGKADVPEAHSAI